MRTPSQTVGPFFSFGLCAEPQNELPGGSVRVEGQVFDGEGSPIGDALLELWSPAHGFGRCSDRRRGPLLVPRAGGCRPVRADGVRARPPEAGASPGSTSTAPTPRTRRWLRVRDRRRLSLRHPPPGRRRNRLLRPLTERLRGGRSSAHARSPRSAPTTSAACFAPPGCCRRATTSPPAGSTPVSSGGSRTSRSQRSCASRRRSASARRPTASSAAPPGTWTSSTSSTAITKEAGHIAVTFHNEDGDIEFTPAALHVDGKLGVSKTIFGDDFRFLQDSVTTQPAEADDPLAEHGPLPRRQGGGRPGGLPDARRVLGRPDRRLPGAGAQARRARLHLPAARRHEPRLHERPAPAGLHRVDRRRPRAPARRVHPPHQRVARRAAGRDVGDDAHVPGQLPLLLGGRGQLRLRRRGAPERARRWTGSSWSGTTSARAASSRCASCPRATSRSCSGS